MKPAMDVLQEYFTQNLLEQLGRDPGLMYFNPNNIRNEAYYAPKPQEINPDTHCVHCGHALEDPDY